MTTNSKYYINKTTCPW